MLLKMFATPVERVKKPSVVLNVNLAQHAHHAMKVIHSTTRLVHVPSLTTTTTQG